MWHLEKNLMNCMSIQISLDSEISVVKYVKHYTNYLVCLKSIGNLQNIYSQLQIASIQIRRTEKNH